MIARSLSTGAPAQTVKAIRAINDGNAKVEQGVGVGVAKPTAGKGVMKLTV
jgi:hypothetical protein